MSGQNDQKAAWQNEADQLKKDLANRSKEYKQREVDIKFGGVKKKETPGANTGHPGSIKNKNAAQDDLFLRRQLGL